MDAAHNGPLGTGLDWAVFYWPDYFCNNALSVKINITIAQSFFFLDEYLTYRQT